MVYITKSNAKRILEKLDFGNKTFTGVLYEKPIYIFNSYEQKQLLAYKGFMQSLRCFGQRKQGKRIYHKPYRFPPLQNRQSRKSPSPANIQYRD